MSSVEMLYFKRRQFFWCFGKSCKRWRIIQISAIHELDLLVAHKQNKTSIDFLQL